MPARIAVHLPHRPVRQVTLDPERTYLLGRGNDCDLQFDDSRLSRRHARLTALAEDRWRIEDLGSKNGLLVDGRRVTAEEVGDDTWISLGGIVARFEVVTEQALEREAAVTRDKRESTMELTRRLDPSLGLEHLLRQVLDSVLSLTGLDRGFVLLSDAAGEMRIVASRKLPESELLTDVFTGSWGAIRLSLESRETLVSGDLGDLGELSGRPSVIAGGIRSLACVPLEAAQRLTGLVYADSKSTGRAFSELDVELLDSMCGQAAVAIGVARLKREIGELRTRLPVTDAEAAEMDRMFRERLPDYRPAKDDRELARNALFGGRR